MAGPSQDLGAPTLPAGDLAAGVAFVRELLRDHAGRPTSASRRSAPPGPPAPAGSRSR